MDSILCLHWTLALFAVVVRDWVSPTSERPVIPVDAASYSWKIEKIMILSRVFLSWRVSADGSASFSLCHSYMYTPYSVLCAQLTR